MSASQQISGRGNSGRDNNQDHGVRNKENTMANMPTKNAAQVAPTGAGAEETGQKTPEERDAFSENSETPPVAAGEASKANANGQAHDAEENVVKAEGGGNILPWGEVVLVNTTDLKANPLSESVYGSDIPPALSTSIQEEGIKSPIIVSKSGGVILSGHTRIEVAKRLGIAQVPVVHLDRDTTEDEQKYLVLTYNTGRDKTPEMKVREFQEYLRIEKPLAAHRKANAGRAKQDVPILEQGKSRDRAAAKVGVSASSLEDGIKVLETVKKLKEAGSEGDAEELRNALNGKGYNSALKLAVDRKWYVPPAKKNPRKAPVGAPKNDVAGADVVKGDVVPGELEKVGEGVPKVVKKKAKEQQVLFDLGLPPVGEGLPAVGEEEPAADQDRPLDLEAVDAAMGNILALKLFLRGNVPARMSDALKTELGQAIEEINRLAGAAGVVVVMN